MTLTHIPDFAGLHAAGQLCFCHVDIRALLRLSLRPGMEPWWGTTGRFRFDDPAHGFGVTYVAGGLDVAVCETILHEVGDHRDGEWWVDHSSVERRSIVRYVHPDPAKTRLRLVDLTGIALKGLGLTNDISAQDDYTHTQLLSGAIHAQVPEADGIRYVSKHMNTSFAAALFERSGVRVLPGAMPLLAHPDIGGLLGRLRVRLFSL
ncbi:RES family NAD+ phosphorylase [Massilia sp. YMA4]|uniref:RES family NAD+ phosphorylase n=1 Tax=[Empedobacter] haloabium TaxID=592317 RepID=A0ABZ1UFI0_9BURK|nr:RES family NAD+ phosphorylase [Massilia sp. YMA4]AXA90150.1 hypothetical protein DPH57_02570 [Massilia sp. YMA4]